MKKLYIFVAIGIMSLLGFEGYAQTQTTETATVKIDGQFYTFNAQDPDNPRNEAFSFTYGTYDNESKEFSFDPSVTYELKGQNEDNSIFVYLNGVRIDSASEDSFAASVQFKQDDVLEIYQNTPYVGKVTVDGQFYTISAQNPDNTRDEAFAFTNNTYDKEVVEFDFSPEVTYTIKAYNQENSFFVYVNGVQLFNTLDADQTGYEAKVKFQAGDKVEIFENTPYVAEVTVNGQFFTLVAQNPDNTRDEAFAFTNNTYDNEVVEFDFSPEVTYTIKAQNESGSFFVYVNGVQLSNTAESGYEANIKFNVGDKIEIFNVSPYTASVSINGQFYTFVAQNPDNTRDEAFAFTNGEYDNEEAEFNFSPAVTYTLKGYNEANQFFVYVNGVELKNEAGEGEQGYVANVKFEEGMQIEIFEATPYTASVSINGQFYTFVAQNPDNTRDEAFAFTNGEYDNEEFEFNFSPAVTYTLKSQNEANEFFVYINGVRVKNQAGEGEQGFVADVKFQAGDQVEIFQATPYTGSVSINGQFYTFVAQNPDNTRDEAFAFTNKTYDNEEAEFNFSPAVTYTLKGQNEANQFFVYVNGIQVKNEAGKGEQGYVANVKFQAGDKVEIFEETPYTGTVTINGQFNTFVAQGGDDNRNEPFVFTRETYDNETRDFNFSPGMTYTLKGQNESNQMFVYINGVEVKNNNEEDQWGYEATVKFEIGDKVEIFENTPYVADLLVDGDFYTIVAQNEDNTRDEAFDITKGEYDNVASTFNFNPGVTYTIKAQNEANSFFVYVNGVQLLNQAEEGEMGYHADVVFNIGDKVEVYEATPYIAEVSVDGDFYTIVAQNEDNTRDEAFVFTKDEYTGDAFDFTFNPGVTYTIKAQNEANSFFVYVNGVQLTNTLDADQTGFEAKTKFAIGDKVEIYQASPYVATVTVNGQFYTFVAQNQDNTRDEAFVISNNTYDNETVEFTFNPSVTYTLKGQNEANSFFVYINGVQVQNQAEEGQTGFVADVTFEIGDNVEIFETTPYTGKLIVNGQFNTFVAQNPDNTRDEAFVVVRGTYDNVEVDFNFSPDITYVLKGQNENNVFYVYINDELIENALDVTVDNRYEAEVTFQAGDVVKIYSFDPSGISNINADSLQLLDNAKIYNLQGVRMQKENVVPGIYIVNGQKVVIR